jgi:DtxR family Mn-dependent transcriptional regulator
MSEREEMYLITIAHLNERGLEAPVPLSRLAEDLSVVPESANQMVKKLEAAGMVHYLPYKGVTLTANGLKMASRVLRHRRLWATFLVDHLGLGIQEAETLACRMEHITSDQIGDRLSSFLGNPRFTPDGKPIPDGEGSPPLQRQFELSELDAGWRGTIASISGEEGMQQFLTSEHLTRGAEVGILARGSCGSILIEVHGSQVSLAPEAASCIRVRSSEAVALTSPKIPYQARSR